MNAMFNNYLLQSAANSLVTPVCNPNFQKYTSNIATEDKLCFKIIQTPDVPVK